MRRLFRGLVLFGFVLGILELFSFVLYFLLFHHSPYRGTEGAKAAEENDAVHTLLSGNLTIPHPYLGFVYDPREGLKHAGIPISPFGLIDDKSPIQKREAGKVLVGITGGSVAWWLQALGREALEGELRKIPAFAGKELVFIRLALGAYKQPQQLQELSYLLSLGAEFDLIINIDGFNEVALPRFEEGRFPYYPMYWNTMINSISDRSELQQIGRIELMKSVREQIAACSSPFLRLAMIRLPVTLFDRFLQDSIAKLRSERETLSKSAEESPATMGPELSFASPEAFFEAIAAVWERSSVLMNEIAQARQISYFHFLQPNQYLPGSKNLSAEETSRAFDPASPQGANVRVGYPLLRRHGEQLAKSVRFVDATQIFQDFPDAAYNDSCCHLTEAGNKRFGEFIGARIAEFYQAQSLTVPHPGSHSLNDGDTTAVEQKQGGPE